MSDRHPAKFKAPARSASPLVASQPLLIADARQAMAHVEKAEREGTTEAASAPDGPTDGPPTVCEPPAGPRLQSGKTPGFGAPARRIAVVPHLTAAAIAIYVSLPVPERDRQRWLASLVRKGFADWSKRALADESTTRQASERLREPRSAYASAGRLTFQITLDRIAALRGAVGDALTVYPDAAVVGVWVALQIEGELKAHMR